MNEKNGKKSEIIMRENLSSDKNLSERSTIEKAAWNWNLLKKYTQARIGQARSGHHITTKEQMAFQLAHAKARDAVHSPWDYQKLLRECEQSGRQCYLTNSHATSREQYLLEPQSGRTLHPHEINKIAQLGKKFSIVPIVSDGLSSAAIEKNFLPFWNVFEPELKRHSLDISPLIVVPYGRVAISDPIGELFCAKISIIFIGERPGLCAADSMGIYLTYGPQTGKDDSQRNCISNVRPPFGLSFDEATAGLMYLILESLRLGFSGTQLKAAGYSAGSLKAHE